MARTQATLRRFPVIEKRNMRGAAKPFKIKEILPQQKIVDIKKTGLIIRTTKARRKSRYFLV